MADGKPGAAPLSTSLFAVNVSLIAVNHANWRNATNFGVKLQGTMVPGFAPGDTENGQ